MEKQLDDIIADQDPKAAPPEPQGFFANAFSGPKEPVQPTHLFDNLPMRLKIIGAIGDERRKLIDCMVFGDEGFIQRMGLALLRSKRVNEFEEIKDRVHEYARMITPAIRHNETYLAHAGIDVTSLGLTLIGICPDRDASLTNDAWVDHMNQGYNQLEAYMQGLEAYYDRIADIACTVH